MPSGRTEATVIPWTAKKAGSADVVQRAKKAWGFEVLRGVTALPRPPDGPVSGRTGRRFGAAVLSVF